MTDHLIAKDDATVYLVGGAVRDALLGRKVTERDWVVVGGTPELMLDCGFKKVGKDFPVFLHPTSHEEYALARTERKSAKGYYGFEVHASPEVTLKEDLLRRDLTINAIAQDANGDFLDPYDGQSDVENRVLRHVSPAFAEDPLRVLRVARFAARYQPLGFRVADETLALMQEISASGELLELAGERVWQETVRALGEDTPAEYLRVLRACGALAVLFPELDALYGVPQPAQWHPEIDTGIHNEMVLEQACKLSPDPEVRFAALCHDLGKGVTPKEEWPSHHGHEARSKTLTKALCKRFKTPRSFRDLAVMTANFHGNCHKAFELKPSTLLKKIMAMDAVRKPDRFEKFLLACEADSRGRTGFEDREYPQADYMRGALSALAQAQQQVGLQAKTYDGDMGELAHSLRLKAIKKYCADRIDDLSEPSSFKLSSRSSRT